MDLGSVPRELFAAALALVGALAVLQVLAAAWRRWSKRRRMRARFAWASHGEERAAGLLAGLGYEVIGAQVCAEYPVLVDEEVFTARVRADYLVRREGLRYVVEVKTGAVAPRIETTATRRQLLEYRVAFAVDGVLLVDAEKDRVHAITFPLPEVSRPEGALGAWGWVLAGLAMGAVVLVVLRVALQ